MSGVYVDSLFFAVSRNAQARRVGERHGHRWSHMWSDDVEALHKMARRIGMKREWFQDRAGFPHYDLTPTKRELALKAGAVERSLMDWKREKLLRPDKSVKVPQFELKLDGSGGSVGLFL